jgi:KAP family P-loop domain
MKLQTKSFESPVSSASEDLLGRWRLAKDVYTIVSETPAGWSCRIGVFGKWGEGKTTLLKFVETQAQDDGLISFWINPSEAQTLDDLWRVVLQAFINALDVEGILLDKVRSWRLRFFAEKTEPLDKAAEVNKYAKAIAGFGRMALQEWLRPDGEQIRKIREKLYSAKILVFVDDLDRTDPKIVPALLLGLRDLLDLPGFCFILAFDEEIISKTLQRANPAWGDGKAFVEKILDFSFSLPTSTANQRLTLIKHHIQQLCPWMNLDVVDANSDLLPQTPRKLKSLLRNLMTLSAHVRRHNLSEIQWVDLFFGQLVRLESPGFLEQFLSNGNGELIQVGAYVPSGRDQPSFNEQIEAAVKQSGAEDEALRARLMSILALWSSRRAFASTANFAYYAGFGTFHRDITQGEFDELLRQYQQSRDLVLLQANLTERADRISSPRADVAHEFLRLVIEMRGACLNEAADRELEADTLRFLTQAQECLNLIRLVLESSSSFFELTPDFSRTLAQGIVGQALKWIHFDRSEYQETRREDREFLLFLANTAFVAGVDWLEILTSWNDSGLYFSMQAQSAAERLINELLDTVKERVVNEVLELFRTADVSLQFSGPNATRGSRFFFFDSNSPLWQEFGRARLLATLGDASQNQVVRDNASELLSCLTWVRTPGGFSGNPEEHKCILMLPGVAAVLWAAATAQRVSYRFQHRLIEIRRAILRSGIDSDQVPIPDWLAPRAREVAGSSSPPEPGS